MLLENKKAILTGIKKALGTIKKIETLVDQDQYCADIAQQVNAAIWLLKSVNNQLLENHIKCCGATKLLSKNKKDIDDFVKELVRVRDVSKRK